MSQIAPDAVVNRTLIVLPGATWRAELTSELVRLGIAEDRAPISAGHVLSRICRHAGYLNAFAYDDSAELEPVRELPDGRSGSKHRRGRGQDKDQA
jgi:hypothetical protein